MTDQIVTTTRTLAELEIVIANGLQTFVDVGQALLEIRDRRLYRECYKTFDDYCRERWGWSRSYAHRHIQGAQVARLLPIGDKPGNEAQARELVPLLDDEEAMLQVWRELRETYGDDVTAARVRGLVTKRLDRVERLREAERRRGDLADLATLPADVRIEQCDFRQLGVADASVDLIFTDPPYPREFMPLWAELSAFAARVLKPGRLCVAYSGQMWLPEVMAGLAEHLAYVWTGALFLPGQHSLIYPVHARNRCKSILFYAAGDYEPGGWFDDMAISEGRDKDLHEWQQSIGPAKYYIERLTAPGDVVCDPFLGAGTTAVAAHELGRHFVGCDVDGRAIAATRSRFGEQAA